MGFWSERGGNLRKCRVGMEDNRCLGRGDLVISVVVTGLSGFGAAGAEVERADLCFCV